MTVILIIMPASRYGFAVSVFHVFIIIVLSKIYFLLYIEFKELFCLWLRFMLNLIG